MGLPVDLNSDEEEIYNKLKSLHGELMDEIMNMEESEDHDQKYSVMRDLAFDLHTKLSNRGVIPVHHKYMIENRGCEPNDKEFYNHVHSVEDLLKFIEDVDANNDPEDATLNENFEMPYYTTRWGHAETLKLTRTELGWVIYHITNPIQSNKGGEPGFFKAMSQDYVSYPSDISYYLEGLWDMAADKGLTKEQVQQGLNDLGEWIIRTEQSKPQGNLWSGY